MAKIVGIDFGTTFTRIAMIKDGKPFLIPLNFSSHNNSELLPSIVIYTPSQTMLVGQKAKDQYFMYPKSGVLHIKRYLGQNIKFHLNGRSFSAEELSSYIFKELKHYAELYAGEKLRQAVLTVPAYFNHFQREGIKQAAELAGFEVIQLLNEPTAAALAYGFDKGNGLQKIMICDLGGGTFDISVLEIDKQICHVLSTNGDCHLGGVEWDRVLYQFFEQKIYQEFGKKALSTSFVKDKLWKNCEKLKESLSFNSKATLLTPILFGGGGHYLKNYSYEMLQSEYTTLTHHLIENLAMPIKKTLAHAKLSAQDLAHVILVGGSTLIPQVQNFIENFLNRPLYTEVDPERIVAFGAALRAAHIEQSLSTETLQEVTPLSLRMKINKYPSFTMIKKNTPIPICQSEVLTIKNNDEANMDIQIHQGVNEVTKRDHLIGRISLKDFLIEGQGEIQVKVSVLIDMNGLLSILIKNMQTHEERKIILENIRSVSYRKIISILDRNSNHLPEGSSFSLQRELNIQVHELLETTERFLESFENKLNFKLRKKIQELATLLKQFVHEKKVDGINQHIHDLCAIISHFYGLSERDSTPE